MIRVGIDAFEVDENFSLEDFRRAQGEMSYAYQPATDRKKQIGVLRVIE
jgi:uncharacterized protein (DUF934 family)